MKKKTSITLAVIATALLITLPASFMAAGSSFASKVVSPDAEQTVLNSEEYLSASGFDKEDFISRWRSSSENIAYKSVNDNNIYFDYICSEEYNYDNTTIILLPDYGYDYTSMFPVADELLKNGYNVILLDQRSHGRNNAETFTFGVLEKDDIDGVIDYMRNNSSYIPSVGLLGQGAGAVTAACYISSGYTSEHIDFAVLEDPFSSALGFAQKQISLQSSFLPASLQRSLALSAMKSKYDVDPAAVDVTSVISGTTVPVFIAGQTDCSQYDNGMASEIYEAVRHDDKKFVTHSDPKYMNYIFSDKDKYYSELIQFISQYEKY